MPFLFYLHGIAYKDATIYKEERFLDYVSELKLFVFLKSIVLYTINSFSFLTISHSYSNQYVCRHDTESVIPFVLLW